MNSRLSPRTLLVAALLLFCAGFSLAVAADNPDTTGWKDLFAPDLSDATNAEHWKWEDGTLVAKDHETLWTKESYSNFILDLDFKVSKEANSGVFLRSANIKDALAVLEIQV